MPLKAKKIKGATAKVVRDEIPVRILDEDEGVALRAYVDLRRKLEPAVQLLSAAEARVKSIAVKKYYSYLSEVHKPTPSVILRDETGAQVRITSSNKYSATDLDAANAVFDTIGKDAATYMTEVASVNFDAKQLNDARGNLVVAAYLEIYTAIDAIVQKFGLQNPISTTTAIMPKPEFHEKRAAFTYDENIAISAVVRNSVSMTMLDDAETRLDEGKVEDDVRDGEER